MGAVFAIEHEGVVYMAADAVKHNGSSMIYVNDRSNLKIRLLPSGILCGAIGKGRAAQRMYLHDEWFTLAEGERFDRRFLIEKIVPRFYEEMKALDLLDKPDDGVNTAKVDAGFIFAKGSDIYMMYNDFSVIKCAGLAALSDGNLDGLMRTYAEACGEREPLALIRKTFNFASRVRNNISMHGYVINTRDLEFMKMEDPA